MKMSLACCWTLKTMRGSKGRPWLSLCSVLHCPLLWLEQNSTYHLGFRGALLAFADCDIWHQPPKRFVSYWFIAMYWLSMSGSCLRICYGKLSLKQHSSSGVQISYMLLNSLCMRHNTQAHTHAQNQTEFKDQITRFLSAPVILLESRAFAYLHFFTLTKIWHGATSVLTLISMHKNASMQKLHCKWNLLALSIALICWTTARKLMLCTDG